MFGSKRLEERLREHGRRAPAEVVEADQGHFAITTGNPALVGNTEILWKLKLRVKPPGEPEFDASLRARFPQLGGPRVGVTLAVLYDPEDHGRVALDHSTDGQIEALAGRVAASAAGAANPALAGSLAELMRSAVDDPAGFRERVREQAAQVREQAEQAAAQAGYGVGSPASPAAADPLEQLAKLGELREKGILTEEEFQEQKRRVLEHMK